MNSQEKVHATNYFDTFIEVAADCTSSKGDIPRSKTGKTTVAEMQFEVLINNPYKYTSDDILFQVFANRKDLVESEYAEERQCFFSKGQACFRASPLTKRYGFGIHFNGEGKLALYGIETEEYQFFMSKPEIKKVKAMRTSKA